MGALVWLVASFALLALKRFALHDAPFWDESFYVRSARTVADHPSLFHYLSGPVVRPPFVSYYLATVARVFGHGLAPMRAAMVVLAALVLSGTARLVAALGGSRRSRVLAIVLVSCTPLYFAQAGLVLSDMAVTAFFVWAWAFALEKRHLAFVLLATLAVLAKESGYVVAVGAAALAWHRAGRPRDKRALVTVALAWVPVLVLASWLTAHRLLAGAATPSIDRASIGYNHLDAALIHDLWEGGRFLLLPFAVMAMRGASTERRATGILLLAFPFLFPGPLPRYLLPTLPLLCALTAIALERWTASLAVGFAILFALYAAGTIARPSWHTNGGHHLDCNLYYRRLLALQAEAARRLAAAHPRAVLATFPIYNTLAGPTEDGMPGPLTTINAEGPLSDEVLCSAEYLVQASEQNSIAAAVAKLQSLSALTPWCELRDGELWITVEKIDCSRSTLAPQGAR